MPIARSRVSTTSAPGSIRPGRKNLHEFVFKGHNHDLNYQDWIAKGEISEGIKKMFETSGELKK